MEPTTNSLIYFQKSDNLPIVSEETSSSNTYSIEEYAKANTEKFLDELRALSYRGELLVDEEGIVVNPHLNQLIFILEKSEFRAVYQAIDNVLDEKVKKNFLRSIFTNFTVQFYQKSNPPEVNFVGGFAIEIIRQCAPQLLKSFITNLPFIDERHPYADIDFLLKHNTLSIESVEYYSFLCSLFNYTPSKYDINFHRQADVSVIDSLKSYLKRMNKNQNERFITTDNESQYMHLSAKSEHYDLDISSSFNENVSHIFTLDAVRIQLPLDEKDEIKLVSSGTNIYQTEIDILSRSLRLTNEQLINPKAFWKALIYFTKGYSLKKFKDLEALIQKVEEKLQFDSNWSSALNMINEARDKHANGDPNQSIALFLTLINNNKIKPLFDNAILECIKNNLPLAENTVYSSFSQWPHTLSYDNYFTILQFGSLLGLLLPHNVSKVSLVKHCEQIHFQIQDKYFCLLQYKPDIVIANFKTLIASKVLIQGISSFNEILEHLFFFTQPEQLTLDIPFFNDLLLVCEDLMKQDCVELQKIGYQIFLTLHQIKPQKLPSIFIELTPSIFVKLSSSFKSLVLDTLEKGKLLPKPTLYLFKECENVEVLTLGLSLSLDSSYYSSTIALKKRLTTHYYEICENYLKFFKGKSLFAIHTFFTTCIKETKLNPKELVRLFQKYGDEKQLKEFFAQFFMTHVEEYSDDICPIIAQIIKLLAKNSPEKALQLWDKVKHLPYWTNNQEVYLQVIALFQSHYYKIFETKFLTFDYNTVLLEITEDRYAIWSTIYDYNAFSKIIERIVEFSTLSDDETKNLTTKVLNPLDPISNPSKALKTYSKKNKKITTPSLEFPILRTYPDFIKKRGIVTAILTLHNLLERFDVTKIDGFEDALQAMVLFCNNDLRKFSLPRKLLDILLTDLSKKLVLGESSKEQNSLLKSYCEKTKKAIHLFYLNSCELFDKPAFLKTVLSYATIDQIENLIEKSFEQKTFHCDFILSCIKALFEEVNYNGYKRILFLNQFYLIASKDRKLSAQKLVDIIDSMDLLLIKKIEKDVWQEIWKKIITSTPNEMTKALALLQKSNLDKTEQTPFVKQIFTVLRNKSSISNEEYFSLLFTYSQPLIENLAFISPKKEAFKEKHEFYQTLQRQSTYLKLYIESFFNEVLKDCLNLSLESLLEILFEDIKNDHFLHFLNVITETSPTSFILSFIEKNFEKFTTLCRKTNTLEKWGEITVLLDLNDFSTKLFFKNVLPEFTKKGKESENFFKLWQKILNATPATSPIFQLETLQNLLTKMQKSTVLTSDKFEELTISIFEVVLVKKFKLNISLASLILKGALTEKKIVFLFKAIQEKFVEEEEITKLFVQISNNISSYPPNVFQTFMSELASKPTLINQEIAKQAGVFCQELFKNNVTNIDIPYFIAATKCLNESIFSQLMGQLNTFAKNGHLKTILYQAIQKKLFNKAFLILFFHMEKLLTNQEYLKVYQGIESDIENIVKSQKEDSEIFLLTIFKRLIILEVNKERSCKVNFAILRRSYEKFERKNNELFFWYTLCRFSFKKAVLTYNDCKELINDYHIINSSDFKEKEIFTKSLFQLIAHIFEFNQKIIPQLEHNLIPLLDEIPESSLTVLATVLPTFTECSGQFKNAISSKIKSPSFIASLKSVNNEYGKNLALKKIFNFFEKNIHSLYIEPEDLKAIFFHHSDQFEEILELYYKKKCDDYFKNQVIDTLDNLTSIISNILKTSTYSTDEQFRKALGSYSIPLFFNFSSIDSLELEYFCTGLEQIFKTIFPETLGAITSSLCAQTLNFKNFKHPFLSKVASKSNTPYLLEYNLEFATTDASQQMVILESMLNGLIKIDTTKLNVDSSLFYLTHLLNTIYSKKSSSLSHLKMSFNFAVSDLGSYNFDLLDLHLKMTKKSLAIVVDNLSNKITSKNIDFSITSDFYSITKIYFDNSYQNDDLINQNENYLTFLLQTIEKSLQENRKGNLGITSFIEMVRSLANSKPEALNFDNFDVIFSTMYDLFFAYQVPAKALGNQKLIDVIQSGVYILTSFMKIDIEKGNMFELFYNKIENHYKINPLFALEGMYLYLSLAFQLIKRLGDDAFKNHYKFFINFFTLLKNHITSDNRQDFEKHFDINKLLKIIEAQLPAAQIDNKDTVKKSIDQKKKEWTTITKK